MPALYLEGKECAHSHGSAFFWMNFAAMAAQGRTEHGLEIDRHDIETVLPPTKPATPAETGSRNGVLKR